MTSHGPHGEEHIPAGNPERLSPTLHGRSSTMIRREKMLEAKPLDKKPGIGAVKEEPQPMAKNNIKDVDCIPRYIEGVDIDTDEY